MTAVFEGSRVWATGNSDNPGIWVTTNEMGADRVRIVVEKGYSAMPADMTIAETRTLARQLYRLARRVEKRMDATPVAVVKEAKK